MQLVCRLLYPASFLLLAVVAAHATARVADESLAATFLPGDS